jgi:dipeptide/tripeptide permease
MLTGYLSSQFTDKLFINMRHAQIISTALIALGTVILSISQSEVGIACALVTYGLGTGMVRPITMKKIKNPVDMNKLERYFSLVNIAVLLGLALIYQFYIGEINLPI